MRKKVIVALMLIMCSVFMCTGAAFAAETTDEVQVPDQYLKKLINITLQKAETDPITKQEMESLTVLDTLNIPTVDSSTQYHSHGIKDLTGLEYAVNLETLLLKENEITDLKPISKLAKLKKLDLHRNEIVDISPIQNLTSLEWLDIYNNKITNINPLSGLTNLKHLDIHYLNRQTSKFDITPLASLTKLEYLSLESNLISDISCLKPVVESGNLKEILARVNHITDFTVLKPMINEIYLMDENGESNVRGLMVGTIGQVDANPIREISMGKEGGDLEIQFPEIKGFEDVEMQFEMFGMPIRTVKLDKTVDGVTASYDSDKKVAKLHFDNNVIGEKIDFKGNLLFAFEMTDFTYAVPVHITQATQYSVENKIVGSDKGMLHINSTQEGLVADGAMEGTVVDENGNPVALESVTVTFKGSNNNLFEATDLKVEGGKYTFKIRAKEGAALEEGNYALQPIVNFKVAGNAETYEFMNSKKQFNLYVSATEASNFSSAFVVDLSQEAADDKYVSRKFNVKLPNNRGISWITVKNSNGKQVYTTSFDEEWKNGSKEAFSMKLPVEQWNDHFLITIQPKGLARDAQIRIADVDVKFVYSKKNADIEKGFNFSMKDSVELGTTHTLTISHGDQICQNFAMSSSNTNILDVKGNKVNAVGEGKATLSFDNLSFDFTIGDSTFKRVVYENSVAKEFAVVKAEETPVNPPAQNPPAQNPPTQTPPSTGDYAQTGTWSIVAMVSLLSCLVIRRRLSHL